MNGTGEKKPSTLPDLFTSRPDVIATGKWLDEEVKIMAEQETKGEVIIAYEKAMDASQDALDGGLGTLKTALAYVTICGSLFMKCYCIGKAQQEAEMEIKKIRWAITKTEFLYEVSTDN